MTKLWANLYLATIIFGHTINFMPPFPVYSLHFSLCRSPIYCRCLTKGTKSNFKKSPCPPFWVNKKNSLPVLCQSKKNSVPPSYVWLFWKKWRRKRKNEDENFQLLYYLCCMDKSGISGFLKLWPFQIYKLFPVNIIIFEEW